MVLVRYDDGGAFIQADGLMERRIRRLGMQTGAGIAGPIVRQILGDVLADQGQ